MKEKLKNPPIVGIIILIVLTTLTLILKTGSQLLTRNNIERYLNTTTSFLTVESEMEIEKYLVDHNIPREVLDYIKNSEYLKNQFDQLVLEIYDYHVNSKPLSYSEANIIEGIRAEVHKYEVSSNLEVWPQMEEEVKSIVSKFSVMYKNEVVPSLGIVFKIFSPKAWEITVFILLIILLILFILKKIWALFYISVSFLAAFLFNLYIISNTTNLYKIGNIPIPLELLEMIKTQAKENNLLALYISLIFLTLFLLVQLSIYLNKKIKIKKEIAKL